MSWLRKHGKRIFVWVLTICFLLIDPGVQEVLAEVTDPLLTVAFDLNYAYGSIHVVTDDHDYRIFQGGSASENYYVENGEITDPIRRFGCPRFGRG